MLFEISSCSNFIVFDNSMKFEVSRIAKIDIEKVNPASTNEQIVSRIMHILSADFCVDLVIEAENESYKSLEIRIRQDSQSDIGPVLDHIRADYNENSWFKIPGIEHQLTEAQFCITSNRRESVISGVEVYVPSYAKYGIGSIQYYQNGNIHEIIYESPTGARFRPNGPAVITYNEDGTENRHFYYLNPKGKPHHYLRTTLGGYHEYIKYILENGPIEEQYVPELFNLGKRHLDIRELRFLFQSIDRFSLTGSRFSADSVTVCSELIDANFSSIQFDVVGADKFRVIDGVITIYLVAKETGTRYEMYFDRNGYHGIIGPTGTKVYYSSGDNALNMVTFTEPYELFEIFLEDQNE